MPVAKQVSVAENPVLAICSLSPFVLEKLISSVWTGVEVLLCGRGKPWVKEKKSVK